MTFSIALVPRGLGSFLLFFPPFSCFISSCVAVLSTRRGASAIEGVFVQAVRGILELADGASRSSIVYTFLKINWIAWVLGAAVMADAVVSTGTCSSEAGMYCAVNVLAGNVQSGFHLFMLQLPPRAIFFHEIVRQILITCVRCGFRVYGDCASLTFGVVVALLAEAAGAVILVGILAACFSNPRESDAPCRQPELDYCPRSLLPARRAFIRAALFGRRIVLGRKVLDPGCLQAAAQGCVALEILFRSDNPFDPFRLCRNTLVVSLLGIAATALGLEQLSWSLPAGLSRSSLNEKKRNLGSAMEAIACLPTAHDMVVGTAEALEDFLSSRVIKLVVVSLFDTGKASTGGDAGPQSNGGDGDRSPLHIAVRAATSVPPEVAFAVKAKLALALDADEGVTSWEDYEPTSLDFLLGDTSGSAAVSSHEVSGGSRRFPDWRAVIGAHAPWAGAEVVTVIIAQGQSVMGFAMVVSQAGGGPSGYDAVVEGAREFCAIAGAALSAARSAHAVSKQRAAEEQLRLQRSFVANINHELRTPLNGVIAFNSLVLEMGGLRPEAEEYIRSSLTSASALLGIINQLLEYSKIEATESVGLEMAPFTFGKIAAELLDVTGPKAVNKGVELVVDVEEELEGTTLLGDAFRLRQVLINLSDNCTKFSQEGGEVSVLIRRGMAPSVEKAPRTPKGCVSKLRLPLASSSFGSTAGRSRLAPFRSASNISSSSAASGPQSAPASKSPKSGGCGLFSGGSSLHSGGSGLHSGGSGLHSGGSGLYSSAGSGICSTAGPPITSASTASASNVAAAEQPAFAPADLPVAVVTIVVRDNGPGIAKDKQHLLFKPFSQIKSAANPGGTGLGLVIAKKIVEAMLGTITLESDEGEGAEFTIQIPFPVVSEPPVSDFLSGNLLKGLRVVVCPEHRTLRRAIERKLLAWDCEASFADVAEMEPARWDAESVGALLRGDAFFGSPVGVILDMPAVAELSERGVRLDDLSKFVSVVVLCSFTDQERMRKLHGDDSRALSILCKPYRAPTLRYRLLIVAGATPPGLRGGSSASGRSTASASDSAYISNTSCGDRDSVLGPAGESASSEGCFGAQQPRHHGRRHSLGPEFGGLASPLEPSSPQHSAMPPRPESDLAGLRAVIVDDNVMNIKVASAVLKRCGVAVLGTACNGQEALDQLRELEAAGEELDVVFMDMEMPVMDGLTAIREQRRREAVEGARPVHIIALTANSSQGHRDEAVSAGADGFLTKPIWPEAMRAMLEPIKAHLMRPGPKAEAPAGMAQAQ